MTAQTVSPQPGTAYGRFMDFLFTQIGVPYHWGSESPGVAFDCSGLVQAAASAAGLSLPRTAAEQYAATAGTQVPAGSLLPGDLVFFGTAGDIHHVGVYVGSGKILNAPFTGARVRLDNLSGFGDLFAATRPFGGSAGATIAAAAGTPMATTTTTAASTQNASLPGGALNPLNWFGDIAHAIVQDVSKVVITGLFVLGGVALVTVGLLRLVKPAVDKVANVAGRVAEAAG